MSEKETAIVFGVGTGLGAAIGKAFADAGMNVALAARRLEAVEPIAQALGGDAYACDVTDQSQVDDVVAAVAAEHGAPSVVAFNAGAFVRGGILDLSSADFERAWRVGCLGAFHVGQAAVRHMLPKERGTILFTGATAALRGGARYASLAVPKFGLRALAQSMAREFAPQGLHIAHIIVDGMIKAERDGYREAEAGDDSRLDPHAIAANYLALHVQPRSAWTQELDLRPWVENY